MDGEMNGWRDEWMERWIDEEMGGWIHEEVGSGGELTRSEATKIGIIIKFQFFSHQITLKFPSVFNYKLFYL